MLKALVSGSEIAAAQAELRAQFYGGARVAEHSVGFPGGSTRVEIAWHADYGIWGYVDDESALGPEGAGGRYWNAFGLSDPTATNSSLSITMEINPPLQGTNARVGGVFAREGDGPVVLLHRGLIGGGKAGVGKNLFWQMFSGRPKFVADGQDIVDCAPVTTLGSETLVRDIRRFADDVARMKASVRR